MLLIKSRFLIKTVAICLLFATIFSVPAYAAENAARYIDTFNGYIYSAGGGEIRVWAIVDAPYTIDELGAAMILLYECPTNSTNDSDWEIIYTYYCNIWPERMITYNDSNHTGCVKWEDGIVGYYYKAQITVYASHEGTTESRTFTTPAKPATRFAENA